MQVHSFDEHYKTAWALVKSVMLVSTDARHLESMNEVALRAITHFRQCLLEEPRSWPCLWGIGKAEQAMGNHKNALVYFEKAATIEAGNVDVWREASISAGALGEAEKAVQHGTIALGLRPNDAGLHANVALAFMLVGDDDQAEHFASRAQELDSADEINRRVVEIVRAVRTGTRERPRSLSGLMEKK